ncbi:MAG: FAD-dependent oxidoreductase [Bryobacteraceae bacterium]|jgi:NAD(P)H-nitrite reductase large subunit/ferredoxin
MRTLVFKRDLCLACRNCELACSTVHSRSGRLETAIDEATPPRRRLELAAGKNGVEAIRCEQCVDPLCVFACKSGAIHRDWASGRTAFDESRCLGCYVCLMVCPSGIRPDPAHHAVVRCDVCAALEVPACVAACPTGALDSAERPDGRARSEFMGHVVVVGSSAAGVAACEAARELAPDCSITLVTADDTAVYSRPLLPYLLSGAAERPALAWRGAGYIADQLKVRVLAGRRARGLKSEAGPLLLDDGSEVPFDRLLVATGARAAALSIPGATLGGVFSFRDLSDLEQMERMAQPGRRAVVLGGGNVGMQACEALLARGLRVTVVVASPHLLSQMVDAEAGRRVAELFARHGLEIRTGREAVAIEGQGSVSGVRLDNGEFLDADLVVAGKGIQPNVEWLAGSGVKVGRGITTDLCGRTSVPHIFAAGDCAEVADPLTGRAAISGIWPVAYEMGRAAGAAAVGVDRPGGGALRMNAARFFGVPIISIGEVHERRLTGASVQVLACGSDVYRKLVYREGRLAGALLVGDISGAGIFYRLYRGAVELGEEIAVELQEENARWVLGPLARVSTAPVRSA